MEQEAAPAGSASSAELPGLSGPRLPALRPAAASLLDGEGFDLRSQARPEVSADKRNAPHEIAASEPEVQKSPVARQVAPRSDESVTRDKGSAAWRATPLDQEGNF
jgi:hypothetical protein